MSRHTRGTRSTSSTLAVAGTIATLIAGCAGSDGRRSETAPSAFDSIVPSPVSEVPDFDQVALAEPAPSDPASDPMGAVRRYLSGELEGDMRRSYEALSTESKVSEGSLADWSETRFQRPTIVDFTIDPGTSAASTTSAVLVAGGVTLEPRLDEVSGFVPQRADVEWKVVYEDGGWRLDLAGSSLDPVLPDEEGATVAAGRWALARQQCRADAEYAGSLLGSPALGDLLCGLEGELVPGPAGPLGDALSQPVVAAFGPDALSWSRSVRITGASELSVVTAPFDDHWVVIGVAG